MMQLVTQQSGDTLECQSKVNITRHEEWAGESNGDTMLGYRSRNFQRGSLYKRYDESEYSSPIENSFTPLVSKTNIEGRPTT